MRLVNLCGVVSKFIHGNDKVSLEVFQETPKTRVGGRESKTTFGCPTCIYSDNGTAFVGASKILPDLYDFSVNKGVIRELRQPEYLASPELANTIIGKLTPLLRYRWADFASHQCASFFRRSPENPKFPLRGLAVLDVCFISSAERHAFMRVQLDSFNSEYESIDAARPVSKESRLKNISLILGDDRLLRLSGRTGASTAIDPNPIVLDGKHPITRLLICRSTST